MKVLKVDVVDKGEVYDSYVKIIHVYLDGLVKNSDHLIIIKQGNYDGHKVTSVDKDTKKIRRHGVLTLKQMVEFLNNNDVSPTAELAEVLGCQMS